MKSERWKDHEAMIRRVIATSEGRLDALTEGDIYALTYCLEVVSDREREAWGGVIDKLHAELQRHAASSGGSSPTPGRPA